MQQLLYQQAKATPTVVAIAAVYTAAAAAAVAAVATTTTTTTTTVATTAPAAPAAITILRPALRVCPLLLLLLLALPVLADGSDDVRVVLPDRRRGNRGRQTRLPSS